MISPRVAGLPSLPGDKSSAPNVNVSVTPVGFTAVGLIRGPLPHAALGAPLVAGAPVESEGKAVWELVSNSCLEGTGVDEETLTGVSFREGKGSGAPSKLCFFYTKSSSFPEHRSRGHSDIPEDLLPKVVWPLLDVLWSISLDG